MRSLDNCGLVNSIRHNVFYSRVRQFLRLTIYVTVAQMVWHEKWMTFTSPFSTRDKKKHMVFGICVLSPFATSACLCMNSKLCYQKPTICINNVHADSEKKTVAVKSRGFFLYETLVKFMIFYYTISCLEPKLSFVITQKQPLLLTFRQIHVTFFITESLLFRTSIE